jgi:hypothetical protein
LFWLQHLCKTLFSRQLAGYYVLGKMDIEWSLLSRFQIYSSRPVVTTYSVKWIWFWERGALWTFSVPLGCPFRWMMSDSLREWPGNPANSRGFASKYNYSEWILLQRIWLGTPASRWPGKCTWKRSKKASWKKEKQIRKKSWSFGKPALVNVQKMHFFLEVPKLYFERKFLIPKKAFSFDSDAKNSKQ